MFCSGNTYNISTEEKLNDARCITRQRFHIMNHEKSRVSRSHVIVVEFHLGFRMSIQHSLSVVLFFFLLSFFHSSSDIRFGRSFVQFHKVLRSLYVPRSLSTFNKCGLVVCCFHSLWCYFVNKNIPNIFEKYIYLTTDLKNDYV